MELHAVHRERPVPHAHDRAVVGPRRRFERVRQRLGDDQRVIASGGERLRDAAEHAAAVVLHRRHLAVHQLRRADDLAAERDADALVAEADAEHRRRGPKRRMTSTEIPASSGRPGPGEMTIALGLQRVDLVERDLVVALHQRRRAQLAEVLREVEGERVVVVDEENHDRPCLRHRQRLQQRAGLVARLLVLRRRVRVGDDAGAGLDARAAVADRDGADRDAEIEVAGEVDVADGAGVDVAAGRLELRR